MTVKLADLYQHLHRRAAATGVWQSATLPGGAAIDIGVAGDTTHLCLRRTGKRLGDTEIKTFYSHCQVPATAVRRPADVRLQGTKNGADGEPIWYVIYTWKEAHDGA